MSKLLDSIFIQNSLNNPTFPTFLIAILVAMVLGLVISLVNKTCTNSSRGFSISLIIIPAAVASIIFVVNGNLGMSVAVLGAFSLVRFRSAQGSAFEITSLLVATAVGIACGAGYVYIAATLAALMCGGIFCAWRFGYAKVCSAIVW